MSSAPKKIGRPATGKDPVTPVRLPADISAALDRFVDGEAIKTRSEAIRTILRSWLTANQMLGEHKG